MTNFSAFEHLEFRPLEEIRTVQEGLFRRHLDHCATNSPYYRTLFGERIIRTDGIGLNTLDRLPLTDKADLEAHNDNFLAAPMTEVSDIVLSSGTTGRPTRMMYTRQDLDRLAFNERTAFERIGMNASDTVLLTCTMDRCFIAGLAYYAGTRAIGAATIRNGLNTPASHFEIIRRMSPTVIVGVPSFLHKLGLYMKGQGFDPVESPVRSLVCIGEPLRDRCLNLVGRAREIEALWGARAYSTYASSEIVTSFCECEAQSGGHLHPALGIVEIVDDKGRIVEPGGVGEVVVTPLQTEGMPLLRFRTGDVSFLIDSPCACGRNSVRLGPILGRKKQMIKFHGTTLYPQAIFAALEEMPEIGEYFVTVTSDSELSDLVEVCVSTKTPVPAVTISDRLQARLRVKPKLVVETEDRVRQTVYPDHSRKPVRFLDKRGPARGML